ncbi:hypothetical protein ACEOWG_001154 [Bacillus cereus]
MQGLLNKFLNNFFSVAILQILIPFCNYCSKKEQAAAAWYNILLIRLLLLLPLGITPLFLTVFSISIASYHKIEISFWLLMALFSMPILLLYLVNINNRSIDMSNQIKNFFITIAFLIPSALRAYFEIIFAVLYISLAIWLTLNLFPMLGDAFFLKFISDKPTAYAFFMALLSFHLAIYIFIRVYGYPEEQDIIVIEEDNNYFPRNKFQKLRMKVILWAIYMLATIVFAFYSSIKGADMFTAFYFLFTLMIAMERIVTHYKNFADFLEEQDIYNQSTNILVDKLIPPKKEKQQFTSFES